MSKGRAYEGSCAQWFDQNGSVSNSVAELVAMAERDGKAFSRKQITQVLWVAKQRQSGAMPARTRGPGKLVDAGAAQDAKAKRKAVKLAKAKPNGRGRSTEVQFDAEHDEGPPPKHTALRKLILDVGLEVAQNIFEEFRVISERMR